MDLSSVPDDVCASILVVSGTAEINLKDPADVMLESSTANATQNGGCCRLRQQCRSRRGQVQLQLHGGLQGRLAGRQEVAAESNKPGLSQAGSLAGMAKQPAGMREVC